MQHILHCLLLKNIASRKQKHPKAWQSWIREARDLFCLTHEANTIELNHDYYLVDRGQVVFSMWLYHWVMISCYRVIFSIAKGKKKGSGGRKCSPMTHFKYDSWGGLFLRTKTGRSEVKLFSTQFYFHKRWGKEHTRQETKIRLRLRK